MLALPRRQARSLTRADVPPRPGVYVWFREGEPIYSGVAAGSKGLSGRVWRYHLDTGVDLSRSSFRRNICEHIGVAPVARSKTRPSVMTAAEVAQVNAWVAGCEVAWLEFETPADAKKFEKELHREWLAPLSRR